MVRYHSRAHNVVSWISESTGVPDILYNTSMYGNLLTVARGAGSYSLRTVIFKRGRLDTGRLGAIVVH